MKTKKLYVIYTNKERQFIATELPIAYNKEKQTFMYGDKVIESVVYYELLDDKIRCDIAEKYDIDKAIERYYQREDRKVIKYLKHLVDELRNYDSFINDDDYSGYLDAINELIEKKEDSLDE